MVGLRVIRGTLFRNTTMLALAQASAYAIPLVTTPYLARVLGLEQFGLLGIAANITANLTMLTDWGFSLSASREVARNAADPIQVRRIFWDTMVAKFLLGVISLVAIICIMAGIGFSSQLSWIVLAGWVQVLSGILGVGWFLQGLESMVGMALAGIVGQILPVPLIFLLVHDPGDTALATAIGGIGGLSGALISWQIAKRLKPLMPVEWSLCGAIIQLKKGWHIFISIGATALYTQINVIVLGAAAGPLQAGLLFGAEKLQRAAKSLVGPLSGAIYPRINSLLVSNPSRAITLIKLLLIVQGAISFVFAIVLFMSASFATVLLLGHDYQGAVPAVRWLSGTVFLVGLSNVLGIQIMLPFGMNRSFMRILITAGFFNVCAIFPASYYYGATGAAISIFITEFIVTTAMGLVIWRSGVLKQNQ
jgi:O-antigen/teichoic acid export membrane protein